MGAFTSSLQHHIAAADQSRIQKKRTEPIQQQLPPSQGTATRVRMGSASSSGIVLLRCLRFAWLRSRATCTTMQTSKRITKCACHSTLALTFSFKTSARMAPCKFNRGRPTQNAQAKHVHYKAELENVAKHFMQTDRNACATYESSAT